MSDAEIVQDQVLQGSQVFDSVDGETVFEALPAGGPEIPVPNAGLGPQITGKYEGQHLQFPLNIEAAEESHWVRFDMKERIGAALKEEEERVATTDGMNKAIPITPGKSFAEKSGEALGGIVGRAASGAVDLAVGAVKSTVNEFISDAAPGLTSLARSLFGGGGSKSEGKGSITMYAPHTRAENVKVNWAGQSVGSVGATMMAGGGTVGNVIDSFLEMNNQTLEGLKKFRSIDSG